MRQIYICLWILYVWAREADNAEAPYRISELAVLNVWHLCRPLSGKNTKNARAVASVLHEVILLHMSISMGYLEGKIFPHVGKLHALSSAVASQSYVDVNLKLFDLLGRIALTGIWFKWYAQKFGGETTPEMSSKFREMTVHGFDLIRNNPALQSPLCDDQAIEIALFLFLASTEKGSEKAIVPWLTEISERFAYSYRTHGRYPSVSTNYRDLIKHPREQNDDYRKEATSGSTLIPLIASWLTSFNEKLAVEKLSRLCVNDMAHCTLQLWLPDKVTEAKLYTGEHGHGLALTDLVISTTGNELLDTIAEACKKEDGFKKLTAVRTGMWPIVLLACRHYRLPVPPQFWIEKLLLTPAVPTTTAKA